MAGIHAKHYKNRHRSQVARRNSARTRREGCTWTTGANGINAASGGARRPNPDTVLAQVPKSQETKPGPGWSLEDLARAVAAFGLQLDIVTGWDNLVRYRNGGYYIALQGVSKVFEVGCMTIFDGDHCIGIHPDEMADGRWRVDDPMCPTATHRSEGKLRQYAEALHNPVTFGVFKPAVPLRGTR